MSFLQAIILGIVQGLTEFIPISSTAHLVLANRSMERAFVDGLSEQSRYFRFMQHLPSLTPQMLARFTQVEAPAADLI